MKKRLKVIYMISIHLFALIGIFTCLYILLDVAFPVERNSVYATKENPVISPSGKYQLQIVEGYNGKFHYNSFNIAKFDKFGRPVVVFASKDIKNTIFRLIFLWDKHDRVWVYDGDTGIYYWNRINDEKWEKNDWQDGNLPMNLRKKIPHVLEIIETYKKEQDY